MYKLALLAAIAFFSFIVWVIYMANTGGSSIFFDFIKTIPYGDKLGHIGLFGVLTLIVNVGFKYHSFRLISLNFYSGTVIVSVFVILEEASQFFIPKRTFDLYDLLSDATGIVIFTGLAHYLNRTYNSK
ncbi:MAG: VanZ family protein [Methylococcales bacterium]|nr:VanZ family protein [Methylococcales bacterium]